ncbi:MAG: hypothetical protein K0U98_27790 [Deltaproteobacteria bacterium]|nr:hypothetical protein [Deltaproteobacteria bacterium]
MRTKVLIAVLWAVFVMTSAGHAGAEAPAEAAIEPAETQLEPAQGESVDLPWLHQDFLGALEQHGDPGRVPCEEGREGASRCVQIEWCCKPTGNCSKVDPVECAADGGTQHATENACYNDVNC